jgi:hypothetical protein
MTTRIKSVSKKREDRRENDSYETPLELCRAVTARLYENGCRPNRILEPGCGRGNFVRAARETWARAIIIGSEIREKYTEHKHVNAECWSKRDTKGKPAEDAVQLCKPDYFDIAPEIRNAGATAIVFGDFLAENADAGLSPPFDLAVGNPPYGDGLGEKFVEKSISLLGSMGVLAFVLKMHFFGTRKRAELWKRFPFYVAWPIIPRPDFTGDGRDTSEYVVVTWAKGQDGDLIKRRELKVDEPLEWR